MATKSVRGSTTLAPRQSAEERRWQAQSDLRDIQSAAKIQSDPKRFAAAQKEAQSQISALASIAKKK